MIFMWNNKLNKMLVLRFPEPTDVGGGDSGGVEQVAADVSTDAVDPFDFSADEPEETGGDAEVKQEAAAADEAEYVLEFGEHYTGSEETTARITAIAKEAGLDAKGFSAAMQGITQMLVEQQAAARSAAVDELKGVWKGDFDKNMKQVRGVLRSAFAGQELSAERKAALKSADVFKLVHHLAGKLGESSAALGKAAPAMSAAQEAEDMLNNPNNPLRNALLNISDKKHKHAAERYNKLIGVKVY